MAKMDNMDELKYFEVEFSDGNENTATWVCIRGTARPTIAEAQQFMAADSEKFGLPVAGVYDIDEAQARSFYDFSNEGNWPVFRKTEPGAA